MASVSETLHKALAHHQAGDLRSAESLYREIVRVDPYHADALHLLGVAAHQRREHRTAVDLIQRAIAVHGTTAAYHSNLAAAYRSLDRLDEAVESLERALEIDAAFADARFNLGTIFQQQGRHGEAIDCFRRTLELVPAHADAWNNLGVVLADGGEFNEAFDCYRQALASRPDFAEAFNNLGAAQFAQQNFEEAIANHRRAVELRPGYAEAHFNLGNVLRECDEFEQAAECYRRAIAIREDYADAHLNLGVAVKELGRFDEAVACYERAIELRPDFAEAHVNRAFVRRLLGDLPRGWDEYEWRWKVENLPGRYELPAWDGSPLNNRSLLIFAEQGVGDEIMFASCVPDVDAQAGGCTLECDPRLVPLLARSFPGVDVIATPAEDDTASIPTPDCDLQIPIGSLPRFVRPTLDAFRPGTNEQHAGYLLPDPHRKQKWIERYTQLNNGLKVGISWRGGRRPETRRARSTSLENWLPLLTTPGVSFVNLQYGDCREELAALDSNYGLVVHNWDEFDPLYDLDEFAAQISALDLVVSIDNSTVHMAGALGVPTWTLLPYVPDWRWLLDRDDSPWYPSMRLFRQSRRGHWTDVFSRVASELAAQASSRSQVSQPVTQRTRNWVAGAHREAEAPGIPDTNGSPIENSNSRQSAPQPSLHAGRGRQSKLSADTNDETWLADNHLLRMDAYSELFPQSRRDYHLGRYRFAADFCRGKRVLDAACGTGYGSHLLAESAAHVCGIDISHEAVEYAMRQYGSARTLFMQGCVESIPYDASSFDLIASFETLEHLIAPRAALAEFARLLDDEGTVILSIPNKWGYTPHHFHDFDFEQFRRLVAEFFEEHEFFYNNSGDKPDRMPAGIGPLNQIEAAHAECVLAVCRKPVKTALPEASLDTVLAEIYQQAFRRHREFLTLRECCGEPYPQHLPPANEMPVVATGQSLTLEAQGLPEEPGRVLVRIEADVDQWGGNKIAVRLPSIVSADPRPAQLQIVSADGRVVASSMIQLTTPAQTNSPVSTKEASRKKTA